MKSGVYSVLCSIVLNVLCEISKNSAKLERSGLLSAEKSDLQRERS
jgi:hypothetical protein